MSSSTTAGGNTPSNNNDHRRFQNATRAKTLMNILKTSYGIRDNGLLIAIAALGEAAASCGELLSTKPVYHEHKHAGTRNASGDDQLVLDIECDRAVFEAIEQCGVYAMACSEETPTETRLKPSPLFDGDDEQQFTLGFDPLDGSSIIDANFAIGGIYGLWKSKKGLMGLTGRDQIASVVSMFGPRTTLAIALPSKARESTQPSSLSNTTAEGGDDTFEATSTSEVEPLKDIAFEVSLIKNRTEWVVTQSELWLEESGRVFAPGNLRATNDNIRYQNLVNYWIRERYTLRYSGGMVPDIYHILIKGKGVFSNVSSEKAKAKLRLVYEVAPVGLLVECAGGKAIHENLQPTTSVLDVKIEDLDQRLGVCMGSIKEVDKYCQFMFPPSTST